MQDRDIGLVTMEVICGPSNGSTPLTLNELEDHFIYLNPRKIKHILAMPTRGLYRPRVSIRGLYRTHMSIRGL